MEGGIVAADLIAIVTLTIQSAIWIGGMAEDWPALYMSMDVSSTKIGLGVPISVLEEFMSGVCEFATAGEVVGITKGCSASYIPNDGSSVEIRPGTAAGPADATSEVVDLGKVTK
jgi:hypothetical protein